MTSEANTLGAFIAQQMRKYEHSNRSLANVAGVSEGAIRNVLKHGLDDGAKDPDARTLTNIASALKIDALRLFRLAGYIPPAPAAHSLRADYLAEMLDTLPTEKQDAVLGVLEAMLDRPKDQQKIQQMRDDPDNPLTGFDLVNSGIIRTLANALIAELQMQHPNEVEKIPDDTKLIQYTWGELPPSTKERIKALIRHKLSLDYDPTMVEPEWRD